MDLQQTTTKIPKIKIFYASETGTALDLAIQFAKTLPIKNCQLYCISSLLDHITTDCFMIFFIATTGKGDPPYSMRLIWKYLLKKNCQKLPNINFSVYALGDRTYGDDFNLAGRKFRKRLIDLGASQIVEIGLGDQTDKKGYKEFYLLKWYPSILAYFQKFVSTSKPNTIGKFYPFQELKYPYQRLKITNIQQLNARKNRQTYYVHMELQQMKSPQIGDVICICPYNKSSDIMKIIKYFNLANLEAKPQGFSLSYKQILSQYVNLSSTVNYSFFIPSLAQFVDDQLQKDKLNQIAQDFEEYHYYIKQYQRNVVEVLNDFTIKFSFEQFLSRIGPNIPRKYSIAGIKDSSNIKILLRLVNHEINANRSIQGVCSHDLIKNVHIGEYRRAYLLKEGPFHIQPMKKNYIILIALGTGIAPFIPILQLASQNTALQWKIVLFFGNRYSDENYNSQLLKNLEQEKKIITFAQYTREGGKRIPILLSEQCEIIQRYKSLSKQTQQSCFKLMMCGPSECYEFCCSVLQKKLGYDVGAMEKSRTIVYQHW